MTRAEFDAKWGEGATAPASWADPAADEWLQDLASIEDET